MLDAFSKLIKLNGIFYQIKEKKQYNNPPSTSVLKATPQWAQWAVIVCGCFIIAECK